jgi:hypothetical protein
MIGQLTFLALARVSFHVVDPAASTTGWTVRLSGRWGFPQGLDAATAPCTSAYFDHGDREFT